jgi:hypothetical protein
VFICPIHSARKVLPLFLSVAFLAAPVFPNISEQNIEMRLTAAHRKLIEQTFSVDDPAKANLLNAI